MDTRVEHQPGRLELWAEAKIEAEVARLEGAGGPKVAHEAVPGITRRAILGAFAAGFLFSGLIAFFEIEFFADPFLWHDRYMHHMGLFLVAAAGFTGFEFWCLFRLGLRAAAQLILALAQDLEDTMTSEQRRALVHDLARAVLEVAEPDMRPFDLDPAKHVRRQNQFLLFVAYRAKVLGSNFLAKLVLRRLLLRSGLRGYAPFVAAPVTGLWNAWVMQRVLQEARFRLIGRVAVEMILGWGGGSPAFNQALLMLVGNRITLYGEYNLNLDILLTRLHDSLRPASAEPLDDWVMFLHKFERLDERERVRLRRAAALLFAFKRRRLSRMERARLAELGVSEAWVAVLKARMSALDPGFLHEPWLSERLFAA